MRGVASNGDYWLLVPLTSWSRGGASPARASNRCTNSRGAGNPESGLCDCDRRSQNCTLQKRARVAHFPHPLALSGRAVSTCTSRSSLDKLGADFAPAPSACAASLRQPLHFSGSCEPPARPLSSGAPGPDPASQGKGRIDHLRLPGQPRARGPECAESRRWSIVLPPRALLNGRLGAPYRPRLADGLARAPG